MVRIVRLSYLACGVIFSWGCGNAMAGEVYICDSNKVITVAPGQLEYMKRTNPCIAAHYGLQIVSQPLVAKPAVTPLISGPVRVRRMKPHVQLRRLKAPSEQSSTVGKTTKKTARSSRQPTQTLAHVEEVAAKPSDYRNIRVINAKSKPAQWYRHVY